MYLLCVDCMTAWHNLFGEWISGGNFLPNARGTLDFSAYMAWYTVRRSHCTKSVEASWATEPTINSTLSVVWFVEQFFMTTLLLLFELFFFYYYFSLLFPVSFVHCFYNSILFSHLQEIHRLLFVSEQFIWFYVFIYGYSTILHGTIQFLLVQYVVLVCNVDVTGWSYALITMAIIHGR